MTIIQIKHPAHRKEVIFCRWIGDVTDERVDIILIRSQPSRVEVLDNGSSVDEVAVVEIVVVVIGVSEIDAGVAHYVGSGGDNSTPGCFVCKGGLLCVGCKDSECGFEICETCLGKGGVTDEIIERVDYACEFGECLQLLDEFRGVGRGRAYISTVVHGVQICMLTHVLRYFAGCYVLDCGDGFC